MTERCQIIDVDGEPIRVRTTGEGLNPEEQEAFAEVIRAARDRVRKMPPPTPEQQEKRDRLMAIVAKHRSRNSIQQ